MQQVDIAIVGAGMAGTTLALALSQRTNYKVALIEAFEPKAQSHPGFDARAIALAQGSVQSLSKLNLWSTLAPMAKAIEHIQVSDRGHMGQVWMHADEHLVDALGQVIELERAGPALFAKLADTEVQLFCPDTLARCEQQQESVHLTLNSGAELSAKLVVGADGGRSPLLASMPFEPQRHDYGQTAIISNLETSKPGTTAFERFTDQGPIALLPMTEDRYSLVWVCDRNKADVVMAMDDAAFIEALQQEFGYRCGQILRAGKRHHYPLFRTHLSRPFHHRVVFVGNAAQSLHPIAGQGFNLGLRDAVTLAECLASAQGADPGLFTLLDDYWQQRQPDVNTTLGLTHGLVKLFSNNNPFLQLGRNMGLLAMDLAPTLGQGLIRQTMGQHHQRSATW
ncbi:2-octaprenyl-6-methoxyphenyl hydroxylase [Ferrimonas aestuarii]|uniref:2-octaprenyl-6-methoxyphenyl hydroxylase n=1 Tax=Ferrimonas aestuarii TaxID=2569539 RepID=UPI00197AB731|nr:2-octaprenyl-6-methoxyphenyl hydroxylase [Ferrimonas aestuarii]